MVLSVAPQVCLCVRLYVCRHFTYIQFLAIFFLVIASETLCVQAFRGEFTFTASGFVVCVFIFWCNEEQLVVCACASMHQFQWYAKFAQCCVACMYGWQAILMCDKGCGICCGTTHYVCTVCCIQFVVCALAWKYAHFSSCLIFYDCVWVCGYFDRCRFEVDGVQKQWMSYCVWAHNLWLSFCTLFPSSCLPVALLKCSSLTDANPRWHRGVRGGREMQERQLLGFFIVISGCCCYFFLHMILDCESYPTIVVIVLI